MPLNVIKKELNGLVLFEPQVFGDSRGFFMEAWKESEFIELGINAHFKQDNHSKSQKNVLRGLHFQWDEPMGKLLRVTKGRALFLELDIRKNSPTLGKHFLVELNEEKKNLLWVPPGFANGFLTLEDDAEVQYKCTAEWNPNAESGILWNDPELKIEWPTKDPVLSEKDRSAQTFKEWLSRPESENFKF